MLLSDSPEKGDATSVAESYTGSANFALENLFNLSPDAIFVTDGQGIIRGANPRASELFGYSHGELVGLPIDKLVPERFRHQHPDHRDNYRAHPRARQMGAKLDLYGLRNDGTEVPVDI